MAAGANQQLIATQLEIKPEPEPAQETIDEVQPSDDAAEPAAEAGELIIEQDAPTPTEQSSEEAPTFDVHEENHATTDVADVADALGASGQDVTQANEETELPTAPPTARIDIDDQGKLYDVAEQEEARRARHQKVIRPLNAPHQPEPKTDLKNFVFNQSQPASVVVTQPEPGVPAVETEQPAAQPAAPLDQPQQGNDVDRNDDKTLEQIEQSVNSPHLADAQAAREAIDNVMADASYQPVAPTPDQDLGAQELPLPAPEVEPSAPEQPQSSAQPLPPELPPPFVPPYMQPAAPVPAELLRRSRDTSRLSDLATLRKAIDATVASGSATLPTTCAYGAAPATGCKGTSTATRTVTGSGWVPMQLSGFLSTLPVEPSASQYKILGGGTNTPAVPYYGFCSDGNGYKLTTYLESNTNSTRASGDGGLDANAYEIGTDISQAACSPS
jgi:hypothetical protein